MHTLMCTRAHTHTRMPCCQAIMEAAGLNEDGKKRKIVVTGCMAQRYSSQLAQDLPEADLVGRGVRGRASGSRTDACNVGSQ